MSRIGIVILATNAYFVLGIRFIKKFLHYYKGSSEITFYFFSDTNPIFYLTGKENVVFIEENHSNWIEGTNSKFKNIISLEDCKSDYLFYFDADTNINREFDDSWFLGDLVGGEHFGNRTWLKDGAGYDKNPMSKAYINPLSIKPKTYYYGAFFGGIKDRVIKFCKTLRDWQIEDKKIPYEPAVNDESYINAYFHYNPPDKIIKTEEFVFNVSDKGGIGETRNTRLDIEFLKKELLENKHKLIDIQNNKVVLL